MKKAMFLIMCLLNCIWASAQFSGSGNGTANDPYLVYTPTQLYQLNNFLGKSDVVFKVMTDMDLSDFINENFTSEGWSPIGTSSSPFMGTVIGANHKITGLWTLRGSKDYNGLFGNLSSATITDLSVECSQIAGNSFTGILAGNAIGGTISGCTVSYTGSTLTGKSYLGGLIGHISKGTSVSNCSFKSEASLTFTGDSWLGGFIGSVEDGGKVTDCSVENAQGLKIKGATFVGGFIGYAVGTAISNVSVSADLTCTVKHCGGIVGYLTSAATVSNVKYNGDITGTENTGGIIGMADGDIALTTCYAKGKISTTDDNTGGIIGGVSCLKSIDKCSYFGDITGANNVGGIIGNISALPTVVYYLSTSASTNTKEQSLVIDLKSITNRSTSTTGEQNMTVKNSTAICNIIGNDYVGGLIGYSKGIQFAPGSRASNASNYSGTMGDGKNSYALWYIYNSNEECISGYYKYYSPPQK